MTERFGYEQVLDEIGLTQHDIDTRPVLAVGYSPEELLSPYLDDLRQQRADAILRYVASAPLFMTFSDIVDPDSINVRKVFSGRKVIEIVGGNANWCVAESVLGVIKRGLYAYVDSTKLFGFNSSSTDAELGRMAMPELGGKEGVQQVKLGENVSLYFRPQRVKKFSK